MQGVSEVIVIILILMITIAIVGLAYTFMSATMASTTSAASSAVTTTTSSMLTSFAIESMDVAKVYVRNTGQTTLTNLSVYINDAPAVYNITPSVITAGQVGTITIYSFLKENDNIKITSPNGFSTTKKMTDPCDKAVGCWKFDEGTGTTAYDSSPYGNTGTLLNGTNWTSGWTTGRYGGGLLFDGVNDYVDVGNDSTLSVNSTFTIGAWIKTSLRGNFQFIAAKRPGGGGSVGYGMEIYSNNFLYGVIDDGTGAQITYFNKDIADGQWHHVVYIVNGDWQNTYVDGVAGTPTSYSVGSITNIQPLKIGIRGDLLSRFNGTIDEVRIYNRAIY